MIMFSGVRVNIGIVPVFLFFFGFFYPSDASTGSHSLRYFYTGVSDPDPGYPEFYSVGYVDEKLIDWYDSVTQRDESRAQWMAEKEGQEYWETQTQKLRGWQQNFKASIRTLMDRYNQSRGVHSWQLMYSCERDRDGSTRGFSQYAYDGQDFISLDKDRLIWVPAMVGAEITEQKWNADRSVAERWKGYLEQTCIEWLQKYIQYGTKELDSKVRPSVKVWDRKPEGRSTTLHCQVTGFYPRDIEVKWVKNGEVILHGTAAKDILPNHDGTYQIQESVEIDPKEESTYSCHVDHSSLPESLSVLWDSSFKQDGALGQILGANNVSPCNNAEICGGGEPKSSLSIGIIIGVIAGVLLLIIAVVAGVICYKKKEKGEEPVPSYSFPTDGVTQMVLQTDWLGGYNAAPGKCPEPQILSPWGFTAVCRFG
ncbi:major histocompatibility complex class I-related gene protein-like [Microcaecilia unicolor]|uniref:Major histocompatibility complex class I-related gene protein-like n=1 Tax=Microcaecilia unicolor TaxID=1415580 RepID=A0A6P7WVE7_9AMPH|nr:major histocompatibility complex class I-related gene protein-like [Microcaecilia unicolor]